MGRALAAMVAVVGFVRPVRPALAEPALDRARAAINSSDYMAAAAALKDALAAGDNDKAQLVEIYRLDGTIAAGLGDVAAAVAAFERMLALAPAATMPAGTSPKITRPFATATAFYRTAQPLAIKVDTASSPPSLTVHVVSDPLKMIANARVLARVDGGAERTLDQPTAADVAFALPTGHRIDVRVIARDDHGNRLAEVGTSDVPLVIVGPEPVAPVAVVAPAVVVPPPPPPPHDRPIVLAWWLYGGGALAAAGVGTAYTIGVFQTRDDLQRLAAAGAPESTARPVQDRGNRDALIANVTFAAAAAFGVGSAVLFATRHHGGRDEHARLELAPTRGGAALALEGGF